MKRMGPLLSCAAMLVACGPPERTEAPEPQEVVTQRVSDDVAGVSIEVPSDWRVEKDPVLFNTYGFALFDPSGPSVGGHERSPVARIALAYQVKPEQIEGLVQDLMSKYQEFSPTRTEVVVGQGLRGTAVSGLPGTDPYTLVYVADGDRVYRIGLWTMEPGLDSRARGVLASLRFEQPGRSL